MIKAVIFDYGGVIVRDIVDDLSYVLAKKFGLETQTIKRKLEIFFKAFQEMQFAEEESLKILARSLDINYDELQKIWLQVVNDEKRIINETVYIMRDLKKRGYKIALLSNSIPYGVYEEDIKKIFNTIVLSRDAKTRKPNKEIYLLTLEKLKVKPQESIFIDNREVNLVPAKELSINTILFQNPSQLRKALEKILRSDRIGI